MCRFILRTIRQWWVEGEIAGVLPSKIRRYRVVDTLQQLEDKFFKFSAGVGLGTREKMMRRPDASPADLFRGKNGQAWQTK